MDQKKQLLDSFLKNPTTYTIEVRDRSMMPKGEIRDLKEMKVTIKPPTTYVLSLCAELLIGIPDEFLESKDMDLKKAMEYRTNMVKLLNILAFEKKDYPEFMDEFLEKNLSAIDLLHIIQETALKCNPSFFLSSIQIAKETNPMMLMKKMNIDSTRIN